MKLVRRPASETQTKISTVADVRAECDALVRENDKLREQVAALQDRLRIYTGAALQIDSTLGLTPYEEKIAALLATHELVSRGMIYDTLYPDLDGRQRADKVVDVFIHKMRPKFAKQGMQIINRPHRGWYVQGDDYRELRSMFGLE